MTYAYGWQLKAVGDAVLSAPPERTSPLTVTQSLVRNSRSQFRQFWSACSGRTDTKRGGRISRIRGNLTLLEQWHTGTARRSARAACAEALVIICPPFPLSLSRLNQGNRRLKQPPNQITAHRTIAGT